MIDGPQNMLIPREILPVCHARGCHFRFQPVGPSSGPVGVVLEHYDQKGQMQGKMVNYAELADLDLDVWGLIAPFYHTLHDEEPA